MITNTTLDFTSEGRPPTALRALKRTLQEVLGIDRWYGTMPKGCMVVWIIYTTDPDEVKATRER
jgi:hypothetical protein